MRKQTQISKRRSAAEWSELVAAWKQSGLSAEKFASRERLNASTLKVWAWRFGESRSGRRLRLVAVDVAGPPPKQTSEWAIELRDGSVLRVHGDLSATMLRTIFEATGSGGRS